MSDETAITTEDEATLADLLTQAVVLAERLLEAKYTPFVHSAVVSADNVQRISATLRALLTAREEFAIFAQIAHQEQERNAAENAVTHAAH